MGHSTARAAMVYLHGSDQRQQVIADALSKRAEGSGASKNQAIGHDDGAPRREHKWPAYR